MMQERLESIMKQIKSKGFVKVNDLMSEFGVSIETVRRDLEYLEQKNLLKRKYGGAVSIETRGIEMDYSSRISRNIKEKQAIAIKTAELINKGDTIIVDVGTTTLEVAKYLRNKSDLTCLTNSIPVAVELQKGDSNRVIMLGGELREGDYSTSGFLTVKDVGSFCVDKAIICSSGLSEKRGVTDYHTEEANVRRKMMEIAEQVILVLDSSKFGSTAFVHICELSDIDILVTDWRATEQMLKPFKSERTKIIIAPKLPEPEE